MAGFGSWFAGEFVEHVNLLQRATEDVARRHVTGRLPRRAYRGSLPETRRSRRHGVERADQGGDPRFLFRVQPTGPNDVAARLDIVLGRNAPAVAAQRPQGPQRAGNAPVVIDCSHPLPATMVPPSKLNFNAARSPRLPELNSTVTSCLPHGFSLPPGASQPSKR